MSEPIQETFTLHSEDKEIQAIEIMLECLMRRFGSMTYEENEAARRVCSYIAMRVEGSENKNTKAEWEDKT